MFQHVERNFVLEELEAETLPSGRTYKTPAGKFPSVTTVLGILSRDAIQKWRKRVGEEEANRISRKASARGTAVHQMAEDYLNNKENWRGKANAFEVDAFTDLKKVLDQHCDNIWMQEVPLYSARLKMAGRVDCIAEWDGTLSIIDFKTASKPKKWEYIHNYFMQAAFYAAAFYELTGIAIKQSVIAITVDHEPPQVFIEKTADWLPHIIAVRKKYTELYDV